MDKRDKSFLPEKIDEVEGESSKSSQISHNPNPENSRHKRSNSLEMLQNLLRDLRLNKATRIHSLISKPINSKSIKDSEKPIKAAILAGNFLIAQELKQKGFYVSPKLILEGINQSNVSLIDNIIKYNFYSIHSLQLAFWALLYNGYIQSAHDLFDEEDCLRVYCPGSSFIGDHTIQTIIRNQDLLEVAFDQALTFGEDEAACCLIRTQHTLITIDRLRAALETGCVMLLRMVWSGDMTTPIIKIREELPGTLLSEHLNRIIEGQDNLKQMLVPLSLVNYYLAVKKLEPITRVIKWPGAKDDYKILQVLISSPYSSIIAKDFISNTSLKLTSEDLCTALVNKHYLIARAILAKISKNVTLKPSSMIRDVIHMLDDSETCLLAIEIMSRLTLRNWNHDLSRQLSIKLTTFIKKQLDLMYCEAPVLFCVLTAEFLKKLSLYSKQYRNRCLGTSELFIALGASFQDSISDEKSLRYYMTQADTRNRSVLEIIAKNRFYELLSRDNIGVLVTKLWIGSESDYGIHKASSLMTSILAPDGSDECSQFMIGIDMNKPYSFQYEKWIQACSHRYMANSFTVLVLIVVYQLYLYTMIKNGTILRYKGDSYEMNLYVFILVMIFGISCENILRIMFMVKTRGKLRIDMWQINDWIISLLIIFVSVEIPSKFYENGWVSEDRAYLGSGILHSVMLFMLCMKYVNIIMTSQSFGPFLSMTLLILKEITTFLLIYAGITLCYSGIFTLLFSSTPGYESLDVSLRTLYMATIGPFVIDTFMEGKLAFGAVMLAIYLLLSHILLLNLLVGIVTNVFNIFQQKIESDYRSILINTYYENMWNENCGMLIFLPTPFTALSLLLSPLVLGPANPKTNKIISQVLYLVYGVPYFIIFIIVSFLALPFAYLQGFVIYGRTGKQVPERLSTNIFDLPYDSEPEMITRFSYGKSFSWLFIGIPWLLYVVLRDSAEFWKLAYHSTPVNSNLGTKGLIDQNFLRNFQKTLRIIQEDTVSCEDFLRIYLKFDEVTAPDQSDEREDEVLAIIKQYANPDLDWVIEIKKIRRLFMKKVASRYDKKDIECFTEVNLPWIYKGLTSFQKKSGTLSKLKKMKMKNENYSQRFDKEIEMVEGIVAKHRRKIRDVLRDCRIIFRRFNKDII